LFLFLFFLFKKAPAQVTNQQDHLLIVDTVELHLAEGGRWQEKKKSIILFV